MTREYCASCAGYGTAYGGGKCSYCSGKGYILSDEEGYEAMVKYNKRPLLGGTSQT